MKDRRDFIIAKAMELYATKGYSNVSITDLQLTLDMGRGTLYYYFKNQDELFEVCMDKYFIQPKMKLFQLPEDITVDDMINTMLGYIHSLEDVLQTWENQNANTSNVVNLMFTAYNRFPALYHKANRLYVTEMELWKRALRNSVRAGVVRSDVDINTLAMMFTHIKDAYDAGRTGIAMDFTMFPKQYNYLYQLIKVQPADKA